MRGDLKLVITGSNQPELFDVAPDPGERRTSATSSPTRPNRWPPTCGSGSTPRPTPRSCAVPCRKGGNATTAAATPAAAEASD